MKIQGKTIYIDLSGGFWGIVDKNGEEWLPTSMPEELKEEDLQVVVEAQHADDHYSIFMWGTPINVLGFKIVEP